MVLPLPSAMYCTTPPWQCCLPLRLAGGIFCTEKISALWQLRSVAGCRHHFMMPCGLVSQGKSAPRTTNGLSARSARCRSRSAINCSQTVDTRSAISALLRLFLADVRLAVTLHRFAAQLVEVLDDPLVAHELRLVVVIVVHDLFQRPPHAFRRLDGGIADRNDEIEHHEIRHAQDFLERLLDVNRHPLRAETERSQIGRASCRERV